jgi:hypothetical protein
MQQEFSYCAAKVVFFRELCKYIPQNFGMTIQKKVYDSRHTRANPLPRTGD